MRKDIRTECDLNKYDHYTVQKKITKFYMMILSDMEIQIEGLININHDIDVLWKAQCDFYYDKQQSNIDLTQAIKIANDRERYIMNSNEMLQNAILRKNRYEAKIKQCERDIKFLQHTQQGIRNIIDIEKFRSGQ